MGSDTGKALARVSSEMFRCADYFRWVKKSDGRIFLVAIATLLADCPRARADAPVLTLQDARKVALKESADIRSAEAQVLQALALVRLAKTWPNPVLSASTAHIATDGSGNAAGLGNRFFNRSYDSIFGISQLIQTAGKRSLRRSSADAGVRSARAELADMGRQLIESVSRAYIAAVEAKEESRTIASSAQSLREEASIAAQRLNAGDISSADKGQLEIAATQRELDAASAEATATTEIVALQILLGQKNPDGSVHLSESLDELLPKSEASNDVPINGLRPDVVSAENDLQRTETDLREQRREKIPDVTLGVQYERNPPDLDNTMGVSISVPLPIFDHNAGGIEGARAARDAAEARLNKVRIQATADVANARVASREAFKRAQRYTQDLVPKSAEVLKTIEFSYRHGGNSLLELLAAERADHDIRLTMLRAQADYAEAAVSLLSALNRIETDSL